MAYIVKIQTGSRAKKNFCSTGSIPLPNKARVRAYIKKNPLGNYKTKITIYNTVTKKTQTMTKGKGTIFGINFKNIKDGI